MFFIASVIIIGLLLTLNLGFFKKLIFLFIFSIILKFACFSDSLRLCKYAGLLFFFLVTASVGATSVTF